jgi:hypothetical protein
VKEKFPHDRARVRQGAPDDEKLKEMFANAKPGDPLKKFLVPNTGLDFYLSVCPIFHWTIFRLRTSAD